MIFLTIFQRHKAFSFKVKSAIPHREHDRASSALSGAQLPSSLYPSFEGRHRLAAVRTFRADVLIFILQSQQMEISCRLRRYSGYSWKKPENFCRQMMLKRKISVLALGKPASLFNDSLITLIISTLRSYGNTAQCFAIEAFHFLYSYSKSTV